MTPSLLYALLGIGLFSLAFYTLIIQPHLLRKILAFNVMGSSVFLVLAGLAKKNSVETPDPVPHAMVITGIVVAVSATALALVLMLRLRDSSGRITLPEDQGS